jgi:uncharacterized membrane protein YgaE (UPF0421/DUF939 family)
LLYAAKSAAAAVVAFALEAGLHVPQVPWFLISAVLVLSPKPDDSVPLAWTRIGANAIGATASLLLLLAGPTNVVTVSIAFAIAIALCHRAKAMAASRSALAAVTIIMMHGPVSSPWTVACERVVAVIAGCLTGLAITYLFHRKWRNLPEWAKVGSKADD